MKNLRSLCFVLIAACLTFALTGCGIPLSPNHTNNTSTPAGEKTYQSILDEYSAKLREATPGLIEEYNNEAANNTEGLMGLAEISNDKITALAEIHNDGVSEMAEIMLDNGSGSYEEYEDWAMKLNDVYMEEAQKITDVYTDSAM